MLYERSCSMKGATQETNFANMWAIILLAKILVPLLCTVWHACFWHRHHFWKLSNFLMKKCNISMLRQSNYFANILDKYFFRVHGACSANYFLTQNFHPYQTAPTCLVNIDQLTGQHVGAVFPHLWWDSFPSVWFLS